MKILRFTDRPIHSDDQCVTAHENKTEYVYVPKGASGTNYSSYLNCGEGYTLTPVLETIDQAIDWLLEHEIDGQVMRYVKSTDGKRPWMTAGVVAEVYIDTREVDADHNTPTIEMLRARGMSVSGTYRGPFSREEAERIVNDLSQSLTFEVLLVKHGSGYNAAINNIMQKKNAA